MRILKYTVLHKFYHGQMEPPGYNIEAV